MDVICYRNHSAFNCLSSAAFAEDSHNLPLYLALIVPFTLGNIDRIHLRVSRLETYSISLLLLKETFQGGLTISLQVDGNDNIAIFAGILWFNYHIIFIANMVFDHRLTFDDESIRTLLFDISANFNRFTRITKYFEWLTCRDTPHYRNAKGVLYELNTTTFLRFASNVPFFLQHR